MKVLLAAAAAVASLVLAPSAQASPDPTVDRFVAVVNAEAVKYGLGHIPVYVKVLFPLDTLAETDGSGITLNSFYAALTPAQFDAELADDFAKGYQPSGCNGIAATAIHEVGHVLDRHTGRVAKSAVRQAAYRGTLGRDLHTYAFNKDGSVNPGEAVAVAFTAVECGSATATERAIYNVLVAG